MKARVHRAILASLFGGGALIGQSPGTLVGSVVDQIETRIPGAHVGLIQSGKELFKVATDAGGVFKFESVAPGDYVIVAGAIGFDESKVDEGVDAGGTTFLRPIMLRVSPRPPCQASGPPTMTLTPLSIRRGEIDGSVVDSHFKPVRSVTIAISGQGRRYNSSTDSGGNFKLSGLAPGIYSLVASLKGHADFIVEVVSVMPGRRTKISPALEMSPCSDSSNCKPVRTVHLPTLCL
jgi:hypothetical protein